MKLAEEKILFFTRTMGLGGTENVILQMCEILKPHVEKIIVCSCGGLNVERLKEMGIKHYEIPDIDSKSPKIMFDVFKKVKKIIKKEEITIVHTHHRMSTFYMHFIKKTCNVKLISTLHGSFTDKKILTKFIYKEINIIACGEVAKEFFMKNYKFDGEKITVINNAIKKEKVKSTVNLNKLINKPGKRIAYIGRLSKEKGVSLILNAMPDLLNSIKDIHLVIVGDGPLELELKEKAKKLYIEKNVLFLGYQREIQSIIQQVDLVVLPSYTEGLPLTLIESFANGKPVVATSAGGTIEIVEDNVNGFLIQIGNTEMLANKIKKILNDNVLYNKMCVEAKKRYEEKYNFAIFKNKILEYYKHIAEVKK